MKIAIIGGGGRVGACTAYALQWGGVVSEVVLQDVVADAALGEAMDLHHGTVLLGDQTFRAGDIEDCAKADILIVTAGLRRRPEESRLDLAGRNSRLFLQILKDLKAAKLRRDSILIVVSNPVDVLTFLAVSQDILPPQQVIGLGTFLDSCRFSSLIAQAMELAPTQVQALVLGEHGDSMVPIWSSATCGGIHLGNHPNLSEAQKRRIEEKTRLSGAEMIRLKGGAGWAVATAIAILVHTVALNQRKVLPVSTWQTGAFGLRDICVSVPTVIGAGGVICHLEPDLWPRERQGLQRSQVAVRETLSNLAQWGAAS
ncbi:lactate/malate dehydrogenase family protein [Desulfosoma sp.]